MKITINKQDKIIAKFQISNGSFKIYDPIILQDQITENSISSIEDLPDVVETNVVNGSTIVYNQTSNKYEIKP